MRDCLANFCHGMKEVFYRSSTNENPDEQCLDLQLPGVFELNFRCACTMQGITVLEQMRTFASLFHFCAIEKADVAIFHG